MNLRSAIVWFGLALSVTAVDARAQDDDEADSMRSLGEKLAMARQGQLIGAEPLWLRAWELPDEVRRDFKAPKFSMRVAGEDPYVMVGGRVRRPGDKAGGHQILAIEPEGVVIDVGGFPVIVE